MSRTILTAGANGLDLISAVNSNSEDLYNGYPFNRVSVVNYGAKGDGLTDDTAAIQDAINAVPIGGNLYFPYGTYMIAATGSNGTGSNGGINITKSMTVILEKGAILQAIDSQKLYGQILHVVGVTNFELYGGTFIGDKDTRITPCENSIGLLIEDSIGVFIHDTIFSQLAGDGLRVARVNGDSKIVSIVNCDFDHFSRWGISIDVSENLNIRNCRMKDSYGDYVYGGGIDIEYEYNLDPNDVVMRNLTITDCSFENIGDEINHHSGVVVLNPASKVYENVTIDNIFMNECYRGVNVFNTRNCNVINSTLKTIGNGYGITFHGSLTGDCWGSIINNSLNNAAIIIGDALSTLYKCDGIIISKNKFTDLTTWGCVAFLAGSSYDCIITDNVLRNSNVLVSFNETSYTGGRHVYNGNMQLGVGLITMP